ncbi:MAG: flagellar protein FlgN [Defluviitaleaceae bacterium]|nr:flagellar protein FlgN [Defluviitaleaceae bacterium]MCL2239844.1 flagellar protein FlgN [Defluviitaleaceae bacterium]
MAGMIDQLIEILGEQNARCEELLGLALEKKDVIVQNDIDALQKITSLENMVISQNNRLERQRITLTADIAEVLGKGGQTLDITALIECMEGQPQQAPLIAAGEKLRETLTKLKEHNDINQSLIQNALEYVEYSLNVIRTSAQLAGPDYPDNAQGGPAGSFDAKQ